MLSIQGRRLFCLPWSLLTRDRVNTFSLVLQHVWLGSILNWEHHSSTQLLHPLGSRGVLVLLCRNLVEGCGCTDGSELALTTSWDPHFHSAVPGSTPQSLSRIPTDRPVKPLSMLLCSFSGHARSPSRIDASDPRSRGSRAITPMRSYDSLSLCTPSMGTASRGRVSP